ncbi:MAG: hypothetical protein HRT90_11165, partial [Candidatus Margulisbacteria bacterium]|nr:hypothetical protein [Candidatus Margulisiibacteriota bacterium]
LMRLPGRKFRLSSEYAADVWENTKGNMEWLKQEFGIVYEEEIQDQADLHLVFEDGYVDEMFVALERSSPVIRKLTYDYVQEKKKDGCLCVQSIRNLERVAQHIGGTYPLTVKLSYRSLACVYRMKSLLFELLKKSRLVRWFKTCCDNRLKIKSSGLIGR